MTRVGGGRAGDRPPSPATDRPSGPEHLREAARPHEHPPTGGARLTRGWSLAGALTCLFALWTLVPWRPPAPPAHPPYLDPSWLVVLHRAFLEGLAFGDEIVFTYGPWGFVATQTYVPGTFGWLLGSWIVLAASIWYAAFAVAWTTMRSPAWAGAWIVALLAVAGAFAEAAFVSVIALFIVVATRPVESRLLSSATLLLAALIAWLGLVKLTYLFLGAGVIVIVAAWGLFARRRAALAVPVYVGALLVSWVGAGQSPGSIPRFVANGLSSTTGYTPAMFLWSPDGWLIPLFLASAAVLVAVAARIDRGEGRSFPTLTVSFVAVLYVAFKGGFVRQEPQHEPIALLTATVIGIVLVPLFGSAVPAPRLRLAGLGTTLALAAVLWSLAAVPGPRLYATNLLRDADDTLLAFVDPAAAEDARADSWSSALARVRENVPLPPVAGPADLYPNDQLVLIANGVTPATRPVFQSYLAYTRRLIGLNEAQLDGASRPRTIFVDLAPIDGHWPTSEDAPNLMTILADYRLRRRSGPYLVFEHLRRAGYRLVPLRTVHTEMGRPVAVPATAPGPVWVSIRVRRTLLGRLEQLAFKPATLLLDARLADGGSAKHRIVPAIAETGFLLSPYLADRDALAALATSRWRRTLAGSFVRAITVRAHRDRLRGYAKELDVSFSRVVTPSQAETSATPATPATPSAPATPATPATPAATRRND